MMGTINCVYETPCGWCSKWDKKCDKKAPERGQRIKCGPVDDAANETGQSECDHEWEVMGFLLVGADCICKKCSVRKTVPWEEILG